MASNPSKIPILWVTRSTTPEHTVPFPAIPHPTEYPCASRQWPRISLRNLTDCNIATPTAHTCSRSAYQPRSWMHIDHARQLRNQSQRPIVFHPFAPHPSHTSIHLHPPYRNQHTCRRRETTKKHQQIQTQQKTNWSQHMPLFEAFLFGSQYMGPLRGSAPFSGDWLSLSRELTSKCVFVVIKCCFCNMSIHLTGFWNKCLPGDAWYFMVCNILYAGRLTMV